MRDPRPDFADFTKLFDQHGYIICHGFALRQMDAAEFVRAHPWAEGWQAVPREKFQRFSAA